MSNWRPFNTTTIRGRLWIGFGVILVTSLAFAMAVAFVLARFEWLLAQVEEVAEPKSAAAYGMEINVIGAGMGVLKYLETGESAYRARFAKNVADFERFATVFDRLANGEQERVAGTHVRSLFDEYRTVGGALLSLKDRQDVHLSALAAQFARLDAVLDKRRASIIPPAAPLEFQRTPIDVEMEVALAEVETWLGHFLRSPREEYLERMQDNARIFQHHVTTSIGLPLTTKENSAAQDLAALFSETVTQIGQVIALHRDANHRFMALLGLRDQLDNVLDEKLQPLARQSLADAVQRARRSVFAANYLSVALLVALLVAAGLAVLYVGRAVMAPLAELGRAAEALKYGRLSHRVPVRRRDEIGQLARAFNDMAEKREWAEETLRQSHVQIEARVRQRTAQLAAANRKLEGELLRRTQAETVAHLSQQRFQDFAESAADWLWETDAEHRVTYVSEGLRKSGLDPQRVLGKRRWELPPAKGPDNAWSAHKADLQAHRPFRDVAYQLRDDAGKIHNLTASGKPVHGPSGEFLGYRGAARDVTDREAMEAELRQSQKMEAVGQLTGGVAHDFNNLLVVILGNLQLCEMRQSDPTLQKYIATAVRAVERGAQLTRQLLAYSRKQVLKPVRCDLNRLIPEMTDLLERTLGEKVGIARRLADGEVMALVDPHQLETALLNLALNARDAMPRGGHLTIETGRTQLDEAYAAANQEVSPGDYVYVAVSDTGTGIPKEILQRVVEPFFTTKEVGRGSGLGLSMVYGFVKQSGGHLKLYSEEGHGTTVKIYLRVASRDQAAASPEQHSAEVPRGSGERILVVEDDAEVRALMVTLLSELGYTPLEAAGTRAALAILEEHRELDLLFTDVVLSGGTSGPELAQEALALQPNLKVLYTSGYTANAIAQNGSLDFGLEFVAKPFHKQQLADKLHTLLQGTAHSS